MRTRSAYQSESGSIMANGVTITSRRIGKFSVTPQFLDTDGMRLVMSAVRILRAEYDCVFDKIDYVALSPYFDKLEAGQRPPHYRFIFSQEPLMETLEMKAEKIHG